MLHKRSKLQGQPLHKNNNSSMIIKIKKTASIVHNRQGIDLYLYVYFFKLWKCIFNYQLCIPQYFKLQQKEICAASVFRVYIDHKKHILLKVTDDIVVLLTLDDLLLTFCFAQKILGVSLIK